MRFVVGDVHGEITKLKSLINYIKTYDTQPSFTFIGDYLDKGESPYETLRYLMDLSQSFDCTFLQGNHEYIWLHLDDDFENNKQYLLKYGGITTIESANCTGIMDARDKMLKEFPNFFSGLVNFWRNDSFVAVHSGIRPEDYDLQLENIEQKRLLFNRYNFIKTEKLYLNEFKVIFGHTGFYEPYTDPYKIGIDTAACFIKDQPLTTLCLDTMTFFNSNKIKFRVDFDQTLTCPCIPRAKPWRMKL